MITVGKQMSEKTDQKRYQLMMNTLRIFVFMYVNYYLFSSSSSSSTVRVLMALGIEDAREDYMNRSISITASIRQKKKYVVTTDMINCSLVLYFSVSFGSYVFLHLSFSFFRTWSGLGWILSLSLSRSCLYLPQ